MKRRVAIQTFGCKANQADSVHLRGLLAEADYEVVSRLEEADCLILNTCTVTEQADREARQWIRRAKRHNPAMRVLVTGCYAQTQGNDVAMLEGVDVVVGNDRKDQIPNVLPVVGKGLRYDTKTIFRQERVPSFGLSHYSKNTRAHVKIQDGCNKFCSFCIIPYARGKNRSVPEDEVLAELHDLRQHGFEEAVLTGIHIGTYGVDRGIRLVDLLRRIDSEKPLPRIRLSSLDPEEVSRDLIDMVLDSDVICPHFHIAIQSGDNDILRRMKRRYDVDRCYDVVHQVMQKGQEVALGTDVIVGFPGESETSFEQTYRLLEDLPISYAHVFPYSKRRNTPAASYCDQVAPMLKRRRSERLRSLARDKKRQFFGQFIGKIVEIVVESERDSRTGLLRGMTQHYMPVLFDGQDRLMRQRVRLKVTAIDNQRVIGEGIPT